MIGRRVRHFSGFCAQVHSSKAARKRLAALARRFLPPLFAPLPALCDLMHYEVLQENKTIEMHTLEEVGSKLGVTRERVRQIEARALRRLRHPAYSRRLRDFLGK